MGGVIAVLVVLLILSTSVWASMDSARYDWSRWRDPAHPERLSAADSPGSWFLACLLLWPVFFPGYFSDRRHAPRA